MAWGDDDMDDDLEDIMASLKASSPARVNNRFSNRFSLESRCFVSSRVMPPFSRQRRRPTASSLSRSSCHKCSACTHPPPTPPPQPALCPTPMPPRQRCLRFPGPQQLSRACLQLSHLHPPRVPVHPCLRPPAPRTWLFILRPPRSWSATTIRPHQRPQRSPARTIRNRIWVVRGVSLTLRRWLR